MYLFGEVFERQMAVSADSCGERLEELRGGGDRGSSAWYVVHTSIRFMVQALILVGRRGKNLFICICREIFFWCVCVYVYEMFSVLFACNFTIRPGLDVILFTTFFLLWGGCGSE